MTEIQELRLIKLEEVKLLTGLGKTTIYELIAKGVFPRAKQTPARRVAWRESEVREWLEGVQPTQPERERRRDGWVNSGGNFHQWRPAVREGGGE